jgi:peptide/nickel transport system substrate-binding protein
MHWRTDRRGLLGAGGALLAGAAFGPRLAWAQAGATLRLRVAADFQVIDPFGIIGELDDIIPRCTTVTLARVGDLRAGHPLSNYAAETLAWQDERSLAFSLREGLTWTNGFGPVTAEDVKFSFERIRGSASPWAYQFELLETVEVTGPHSGVIRLTQPFAPFPVIALPYYGGHLVSRAGVEAVGGRFTTEAPAECGPYLFEAWEQGQKVTLRRNPDWTGETTDWDRIEFYVVPDDQSALLAYEADAFDFTRVAVVSLRSLREAPPAGAVLIEAPSTTYVFLSINMNAEPLRDPRVRLAIQLAFDGEAVLQGAYDGAVTRATGVIHPSSPFARPANIHAVRDVERARALLAEAGAEGIVLQLVAMTDTTSQTIAQIIQASLAEAGITVEIQPTDAAAYWALGDKTAGEAYRSLELTLMGYAGGIDPTENLVWFRPDQIGAYNWSFFDSAEFEELFQAVRLETDEAERRRMFNRMEDLMEESGGFVFIAFEPYLAVHDSTIAPVILADGHPDPTRFRRA